MIAALTAALMSTIDTLINACAAIGIYDIYKPLIKPDASEKHYLKAARWASVLATVIGVLLVIWFSKQQGSLMSIHYKGIMVIIPSIVTTIFLGAFWKRFTPVAACVSMVTGSVLTLLSNGFSEGLVARIPLLKYCGPHWIDPLAAFVSGPHNDVYIYMRALFGMVVTAVVGIVVSLVTQPRKPEEIAGLTAGTLDEGMEIYKGGKPNHTVGEKVRRLPVVLDESLPELEISLSKAVMKRLRAEPGDIVYVEDSRWFLGGLRSEHTKAVAPHERDDDAVVMSSKTFTHAYLLDGHPVTLEKIL